MGWINPKRFEEKFSVDKNLGRYGSTWWGGNEDLRRFAEREVLSQQSGSTLGLSQVANSHKRGLKGITSSGARLVRNAAYLLQKKYSKFRLSFLTLTLPPMSIEDEKALALQWSRVVRTFGQRLKRTLQSRGLSGNYVGVTEVQQKRFDSGRGIGLHLHLVFQGKKRQKGGWAIAPEEFRSMWCSVLSTVLGREVWSNSCEEVKQVKKSAEGYLGKYMSKGVQIIEAVIEKYGEDAIPSAWYTATAGIKKAIASRIRTAWDRDINVMEKLAELSVNGVIERPFLKFLDIDGREFLIGVSFRIRRDRIHMCHKELRDFVLANGKRGIDY